MKLYFYSHGSKKGLLLRVNSEFLAYLKKTNWQFNKLKWLFVDTLELDLSGLEHFTPATKKIIQNILNFAKINKFTSLDYLKDPEINRMEKVCKG